MSTPKHRGKGGVYVHPKTGERFYGVTSLTKAVEADPGSLIGWAARETAKAAIETRAAWDPLDDPDDAEVVIKARSYARRVVKRDVGTAVHDAIEARVRARVAGGKLPAVHPSIARHVASFDDFCDEYAPTFLELETTVLSRTFGYAGTLDALAEVPGVGLVLMDWKTGTVRVGGAAQLVLLDCAEAVLEDDGSERVWAVSDELWLVQITAAGFVRHKVAEDARYGSKGLIEGLVEAKRFGDSEVWA